MIELRTAITSGITAINTVIVYYKFLLNISIFHEYLKKHLYT